MPNTLDDAFPDTRGARSTRSVLAHAELVAMLDEASESGNPAAMQTALSEAKAALAHHATQRAQLQQASEDDVLEALKGSNAGMVTDRAALLSFFHRMLDAVVSEKPR